MLLLLHLFIIVPTTKYFQISSRFDEKLKHTFLKNANILLIATTRFVCNNNNKSYAIDDIFIVFSLSYTPRAMAEDPLVFLC